MRPCLAVLPCLALVLFSSVPASAQPAPAAQPAQAAPTTAAAPAKPAAPTLEQVLALGEANDRYKSVAISPDGARVAWVEALPGPDGKLDKATALFVAELDAAGQATNPRRVTSPGSSRSTKPSRGGARHPAADAKARRAAEHAPAWAPDGHRLAFLSDAEAADQDQLYVVDATAKAGAGAAPKRLTSLQGQLADVRWSPDGARVAFLFTASKDPVGPLAPAHRDSGVVGEELAVQVLKVVDLESGKLEQVGSDELHVYEYDWSPDSASFVFTAAEPPGDGNYWVAQLWSYSSGELRPIYKPRFQLAYPRYSPDGKSVAFLEGLMSDAGANGGDVMLLDLATTKVRNLTPGLAASPAWLAWTSPRRIVVAENVDGDTAVAAIDVAETASTGGPGATMTTLWRGPEQVSAEGNSIGLSIAGDGASSAILRSSFRQPPEVWAGPVGAWKQATRGNAAVSPAWGEARSLHWQSDGTDVQGWLLAPPAPMAPLPEGQTELPKLPLVVVVHGGPAGVHKPGWPTVAGALASQGFLVLLPNPRGSFGHGEAFTQGNVKDFGYGDLRDIMAGVDAAIAKGGADPDRLGIFGWSYGGYMTMWAVTQTDRFKGAVAGAGIANWQSYYGQNRINTWMIPYFGASVYDDPWIYARSSPISFIKNVKTPTLVLQGERDAEVPAPQAYEFWRALKDLHQATDLVIYADEGHHFRKPENDVDRIRRVVEWMKSSMDLQ